jgi:AraC-like DNA-binding protein
MYLHSGNFFFHSFAILINIPWGAFLFLLIKRLKYPEKNNSRFEWHLFIPAFLYLPVIAVGILNPEFRQKIVYDAEYNVYNTITFIYNLVICFYSILVNLILLISEIKDKSPENPDFKKALKERKEMLTIMLILQLAAFLPFIFKADISYIILYMPVFGQIFFIYMFFRLSQSTSAFILQSYHSNKSAYLAENIQDQSIKYASIKIENEKIEAIFERINKVMINEKPYLQMNLSIADLSKKLDILPNVISMVINSRSNSNFPEFVNTYRVKHAMNLLLELDEKKMTIESVAYDSGFSNRTSFYNSFRKYTGQLPSEFMKQKKGELNSAPPANPQ